MVSEYFQVCIMMIDKCVLIDIRYKCQIAMIPIAGLIYTYILCYALLKFIH